MKVTSFIIGSTMLYNLGVYADLVHDLYDIKGVSKDQLDNNTIQWDFSTSSVIELVSPNCSNQNPGKNSTELHLLFETKLLNQHIKKPELEIYFDTYCKGHESETWVFPKKTLMHGKEFTQVTMNTTACQDNDPISDIDVSFNGVEYIGDGRKLEDSAPKDCKFINNFKTAFIQYVDELF